jgi:hypothetical protein
LWCDRSSRPRRWHARARIVVLQTCDYYANVIGQVGGALARVPVRLASRRDLNPGRCTVLPGTTHDVIDLVRVKTPASEIPATYQGICW